MVNALVGILPVTDEVNLQLCAAIKDFNGFNGTDVIVTVCGTYCILLNFELKVVLMSGVGVDL